MSTTMFIVYGVIAVCAYYCLILGFNRSMMRDDVQTSGDATLWAMILLCAAVIWPVSLVIGAGAFLITRMVNNA